VNLDPCVPTSKTFELFTLEQNWTEGCGVDVPTTFDCDYGLTTLQISNNPSNWFYADSIGISGTTWSSSGTTIAESTLECGDNCVLTFDVTNYVHHALTGNTYGLGIKYKHEDEEDNSSITLYSRHTNSFYKPFLETVGDNVIKDNRNAFILGEPQRLFYFTNGEDLDTLPTVDVLSENNILQQTLTAQQFSKGIYFVEFTLPQNTQTKRFWYDNWYNVVYKGHNLTNKKNRFLLVEPNSFYNFGAFENGKRLSLSVSNIKDYEIIHADTVRRIEIVVREQYKKTEHESVDKIEWCLTNHEQSCCNGVTKWCEVNYIGCDYSFLLHTHNLIGKWWLNFKITNKGETIFKNKILQFDVV
jgi:hypothetical protein